MLPVPWPGDSIVPKMFMNCAALISWYTDAPGAADEAAEPPTAPPTAPATDPLTTKATTTAVTAVVA